MGRSGRLLGFFDFFLSTDLRETGRDEVRRAHLLVAVSLVSGVSTLVVAAINLLSGRAVPGTSIAIPAIAGLVFLAVPVLLKASGELRALSWVLVFGTLIAITVAAWNAYGLYSPGLLTLPVPVLIGLVLGGRRLGISTAAIGLFVVIGFYVLERRTEIFPPPPLDAGNALLLVSVLGLGIVLVAAIGWFYESLRRRAFEQASDALKKAEAANDAKREFLASMSHELRTPLNSVIGFAQIVREKEELSSSGDDMLERVRSSGIHLLRLVDQILDVSKVEAGEIEMHLEAVDVAKLVRRTLKDLESQKPREHVELIGDLPQSCNMLNTDSEKFRQIVVNLVVNAFKFTRQGSVTVRLVCESDTPVRLEVQDTGIGIPAEKLEEIFERFVQVDTGTSRSFDGTGLGLSICKDLCDLMGYELGVESKSGKGTTFRVRFS